MHYSKKSNKKHFLKEINICSVHQYYAKFCVCVCICVHAWPSRMFPAIMIRKRAWAQVSWLVNLTHKQNGTWRAERENRVSEGGEVIAAVFITFYLLDYV